MKKLLGLLAATGLVATTGATTVVACNNDKGNGNDSVKVDLGTIDNILPQTIFAALKAKNSSIDTSQLEVFSYDATSAKLVYKKGTSNENKNPISVSYKIKALDISENNVELVSNIIAGDMNEFGYINKDWTIAKVMSERKITKWSIIDSFARMNGTYLTDKDIEVGEIDYETQRVTITSKNQEAVKGEEVIVSLNTGVNSDAVMKITDIGSVYVPSAVYDNAAAWFDGAAMTEDGAGVAMLVSYPLLFQNIGDRNRIFAYLAADIGDPLNAMYILAEATSNIAENLSTKHVNFNLSWGNVLTSFISSESTTTTFNFELKKEDRIIFGEWAPNEIKVSKKAFDTNNKVVVIEEIYKQMDDEFKEKISLEYLTKYADIHFDVENNAVIEILAAGDYLYAMNNMAYTILSGTLEEAGTPIEEKYIPPMVGKIPGYKFVVTE